MRRLLLATASSLLLGPVAHAWGPDGHQTVATIAAGLLKGTPTEARVNVLLGDIPLPLAAVWADCAKGISPAQGYGYPNPGKYAECAPLETLARIAEMADYVRRNDRQCGLAREETCHKQTHYADVALQRSRYLPGFTGTREDDVVGSLRQAILVLQGKPAPGQPSFKGPREALLMLLHLVGDIHQPLHVVSVYVDATGAVVDPDEGPFDAATETRGGNDLIIGSKNLHAEWDSVASRVVPQPPSADVMALARAVPVTAGDVSAWSTAWATETLTVGKAAFDGISYSTEDGQHHHAIQLPAGYSKRRTDLQREEVAKAGARLAQVLTAIWP